MTQGVFEEDSNNGTLVEFGKVAYKQQRKGMHRVDHSQGFHGCFIRDVVHMLVPEGLALQPDLVAVLQHVRQGQSLAVWVPVSEEKTLQQAKCEHTVLLEKEVVSRQTP